MAYQKLQYMIILDELRSTELVRIGIRSTDKNEAMEIANAIAEEYRRKRIDDQSQWANNSLAQLEDEVEKQRKKVDDLQAEMAKIGREANVVDLNPNSAGRTPCRQETSRPHECGADGQHRTFCDMASFFGPSMIKHPTRPMKQI